MQEGSEHFKALNEIQGITAHDKEYEIAFLADDILLSLSETQASIQCLGEVWEVNNPVSGSFCVHKYDQDRGNASRHLPSKIPLNFPCQ